MRERIISRTFAGELAVHECAQHVVVGHAGKVARRVEPGHRGRGMLIHPHPGSRVATAQADFRDVHFHHTAAVVEMTSFVETPPARALVGMQDVLDGADRLFRQVIHLEENRAIAAFEFLVELHHHLAAPVVALDEALALGVGGIPSKGSCDIGA